MFTSEQLATVIKLSTYYNINNESNLFLINQHKGTNS